MLQEAEGSRGILELSGFDQTTRRISFDVLGPEGRFCNCEILCNGPSSRGLDNRPIIVQGPAIGINWSADGRLPCHLYCAAHFCVCRQCADFQSL